MHRSEDRSISDCTPVACNTAFRGLLSQVVQQRRLTDARFTRDDEGPALAGANRFDELVQHAALNASAR